MLFSLFFSASFVLLVIDFYCNTGKFVQILGLRPDVHYGIFNLGLKS